MRARCGRSLLRRKIRSRLKRYALNHNFIRWARTRGIPIIGSTTLLLSRRGHNDFRVLDPINYSSEDSVLLIEIRLSFQRDVPLAVRSVNVARARGAERPALVRNVAEFRRDIWIRRIARAPGGGVTTFSQRIAALNNSQVRIDPVDGGAIKDFLIN